MVVLLCSISVKAEDKADMVILTNEWPPYIEPEDQPLGAAAQLVKLIAYELDKPLNWQYQSFDAALFRTQRVDNSLAFPFFKTPHREQSLLYSQPVFSVTSQLYYNRQFSTNIDKITQLTEYKVGRVAGYSYGVELDEKVNHGIVYPTEESALRALFNNDIQFLPMTVEVMNYMLDNDFPNRKELIKPLPEFTDTSSLYFVAAKTEYGQQSINKINQAISVLSKAGLLKLPIKTLQNKVALDVAVLMSAEGNPIIVGVESADNFAGPFYALPTGTRVLVLEWSAKMKTASNTEAIYKTMVEPSRVVILNGPHVGKELYVRTMHINLM